VSEDIAARIRRHAEGLGKAGRSPLSVGLMLSAADDMEAGGIVAERFAGLPAPAGSVPGLRLLAALHWLVLSGRAPELAAHYPGAGGSLPPAGAWPPAERALREHAAAVPDRGGPHGDRGHDRGGRRGRRAPGLAADEAGRDPRSRLPHDGDGVAGRPDARSGAVARPRTTRALDRVSMVTNRNRLCG
jgi:hypothetical protein